MVSQMMKSLIWLSTITTRTKIEVGKPISGTVVVNHVVITEEESSNETTSNQRPISDEEKINPKKSDYYQSSGSRSLF
jgi:hypothetical protein